MRDPRFLATKATADSGLQGCTAAMFIIVYICLYWGEPCLVSIETRAYNPYQTLWNIILFATLTGAFRGIICIYIYIYFYIFQLWNKKAFKDQVSFVFVEKRFSGLHAKSALITSPFRHVTGSEETCTRRGSARGWHLSAGKGRWGPLVLVEVTSRMSVIHRRSTIELVVVWWCIMGFLGPEAAGLHR